MKTATSLLTLSISFLFLSPFVSAEPAPFEIGTGMDVDWMKSQFTVGEACSKFTEKFFYVYFEPISQIFKNSPHKDKEKIVMKLTAIFMQKCCGILSVESAFKVFSDCYR